MENSNLGVLGKPPILCCCNLCNARNISNLDSPFAESTAKNLSADCLGGASIDNTSIHESLCRIAVLLGYLVKRYTKKIASIVSMWVLTPLEYLKNTFILCNNSKNTQFYLRKISRYENISRSRYKNIPFMLRKILYIWHTSRKSASGSDVNEIARMHSALIIEYKFSVIILQLLFCSTPTYN